MPECYACGAQADSLSERGFCPQDEADFKAGEQHSEYVVQRASRLEEAREAKDFDTVGAIAAEIAKEGAEQPLTQTIDVSPQAGVSE